MNESELQITVKKRDYKCTPERLELIADEWMGKPLSFSQASDEITFEFTRKDWAEGFLNSIQSSKN